jgi:predicted GIY-YIG superfamily endonuclease
MDSPVSVRLYANRSFFYKTGPHVLNCEFGDSIDVRARAAIKYRHVVNDRGALRSMKPKYKRMLRAMENKAAKKKPRKSVAQTAALWHLYILECGDGSLYTGVTTDIERRFSEHQEGTGSRYTRTRRPVVLVHQEECGSRSQALSRECAVKSLPRRRKDDLIRR